MDRLVDVVGSLTGQIVKEQRAGRNRRMDSCSCGGESLWEVAVIFHEYVGKAEDGQRL